MSRAKSRPIPKQRLNPKYISVRTRYIRLINGLKKYFPMFNPLSSTYAPEQQILDRAREVLDNHKKEVKKLQDALDSAMLALDDITALYAPEMYGEKAVKEAEERVFEHGQLYYIASVMEKCAKARGKK